MTTSEGSRPFKSLLHEYQCLVNARLQSVLKTDQPPLLYKPIEYVLNGGGKRVRPTLLILACRAVQGSVEACLDAAAAVELLHNFTLVHDDMMDQDSTRRGCPTVHAKWDNDVALLAGDVLFGLAYDTLLNTKSDQIRRIAQVFTRGVMELCQGQALDLEFEKRRDVELGEYLSMIGKKTARLLSVSTEIGAIIGEGTEAQIEALKEFGFNVGCAFQIQDDLLDITSDEATLGKTFGSDIKRKKQTFLLIHALTHSNGAHQHELSELLKIPEVDQSQIIQVRTIFERVGSLQAARSAISKYLSSAESSLATLPLSEARNDLGHLLEYLYNRKA